MEHSMVGGQGLIAGAAQRFQQPRAEVKGVAGMMAWLRRKRSQ
tara:strand:+ start:216 stop:344 length:129 start_codon:yes stop_codon:yes gene_type:complete